MLKIIMSTLMLFAFQSSLQAGTEPTLENTTKLYVATFNRAPDAGGLDYWANDAGLDLEGIAQSFFDQPETKEAYPADSTNTDFVEAVYQNLFNRASEKAGLAYWVAELDSGRIAKSTFILAVINGAQDTQEFGNDATILTNKTTVGQAFANAGLEDLTDAREIMLAVTADESTVTTALRIIEEKSSIVHTVTNLAEFRIALEDAVLNDNHDVIILNKGIYTTTSDGFGTFEFADAENFNLTIRAADGLESSDVVLDGDNTNRVLKFTNSSSGWDGTVTLFLKNISIVNGKSVSEGGGIYCEENIKIENCNVSNNTASNQKSGGGIYAFGPMTTITGSIISNNSAGYGGGIHGRTVNITDSLISDNDALDSNGGGYLAGGTVLINSSILRNSAKKNGGGFYAGTVVVKDSNISENMITSASISLTNAYGDGGGFYAGGSGIAGVVIDRSIISNNSATRNGGGFKSYYMLVLTNSIFTNNSAKEGATFSSGDARYGSFVSNNNFIANNGAVYANSGVFLNNIFKENASDLSSNGTVYIYNNYLDYAKVSVSGSAIKKNNFQSTTIEDGLKEDNMTLEIDSVLIDNGLKPDLDSFKAITADEIFQWDDYEFVYDQLLESLVLDINKNPRVNNNTIDIGAYEH